MVPTGIPAIDRLLADGYPDKSAVLIVGAFCLYESARSLVPLSVFLLTRTRCNPHKDS